MLGLSAATSRQPADRPVQAAIAARRTTREFLPDAVPREVIERLLAAAVQAPNHRRTAPWRFFVLDRDGPARQRLAELAWEAALARGRSRADKKRREILATPVVLLVYVVPGRDAEESRENYAAVACAVQNLMLAAVEEGLASGWSTGGLGRHPRLAAAIGAPEEGQLVALVYLGRAASAPAEPPARTGAAAFTRWLCDG